METQNYMHVLKGRTRRAPPFALIDYTRNNGVPFVLLFYTIRSLVKCLLDLYPVKYPNQSHIYS